MDKNRELIDYSFGVTFEGKRSIAWFFIMMFGLVSLGALIAVIIIDDKNSPPVSLWAMFKFFLLALVSIPIIINKKGTYIDVKNKEYKYYRDFFISKVGIWKPLGAFKKLILIDDVVSGKFFYTLKLFTDYEKIILKEFYDYDKAIKFLEDNGKILNIPTQDKTRRNSNQQKGKRRK